MNKYLKSDEFVKICYEADFSIPDILRIIRELHPGYTVRPYQIEARIANYRRKGLLPLDSGNIVSHGEILKGTSTLYDEDGNIKLQWIKSDVAREQQFEAVKTAIESIVSDINPVEPVQSPLEDTLDEDLLTFYPLPDLHLGVLINNVESNHEYNYDTKIATAWITGAMNYLVDRAPSSTDCVIADLGDFLHSADNSARTVSGHILDMDGRISQIIKISYQCITTLIDKALTKHKNIYFYSVPGNHSQDAPIYLKAFLQAWYKNEPRVKIFEPNKEQQYYRFGKVILGFSHGHTAKPAKGESILIADNIDYISKSKYRYMHWGHYHKDKVIDGPLVKQEIHQNIMPRDAWAEGMGFRGNIGIAKSIVYHKEYGEISRNTFNIQMRPDLVKKAKAE